MTLTTQGIVSSLFLQEFYRKFFDAKKGAVEEQKNKIDSQTYTNYTLNPNIRSIIFTSLNTVASKVTLALSTFYQQFVEYAERLSFFDQAKQKPSFQYYQLWCAKVSEEISDVHNQLQGVYPHVFRKALLLSQINFETTIVSPLYYQQSLKKLEQKLAGPYADVCREARYRLIEKLEADSGAALRYFYQDIINNLIQLSGYQIEFQTLLKELTYYEKLVPSKSYKLVMESLRSFIGTHFKDKESTVVDFYKEKIIPVHQYEALWDAINFVFAPHFDSERITEEKIQQNDHRLSINFDGLKRHPFVAAGIIAATLGSLAYDYRGSLSTVQPLTIVSGAALGCSFFHQTSYNPMLGSAVSLLPALFSLGSAQMASFDLTSLNGNNGFVVNGINSNDWSGNSISSGDINGDNITDLLIGAPYAPSPATEPGQTYVIFGSKSLFPASIDLSSLNGTNGFVVQGNNYDESGLSISSGDMNGDSITDLFICGPLCHVIFGSRSPFPASFSVSNLNGTNGFTINGSGSSISSGDINNDQITDLFIGAYYEPSGMAQGKIYVIFGSRSFFPAIFSLSNINGINGFVVNGIDTNDHAGYSIDSGDINSDKITDLLIGAPGAPRGRNRGQGYVLYGSKNPFPASFNLTSLDGTNGFAVNGINNGDSFGSAISSGDINDDHIDDLLIGAPSAPSGNYIGQCYVLYGSKNQFPANFNTTSLNGTNGFVINGINIDDVFGSSISSGDVNDDNITDLLVGAPEAPAGQSWGQSFVIFGSRNTFPAIFDVNSLTGINGFVINGISNYVGYSGTSIYRGDINGDHITDLLIGAPYVTLNKGQSYVVFGQKYSIPLTTGASPTSTSASYISTGTTPSSFSHNSLESSSIYFSQKTLKIKPCSLASSQVPLRAYFVLAGFRLYYGKSLKALHHLHLLLS